MRTARVVGAGLLAGLVLNIGEAALHSVVFCQRRRVRNEGVAARCLRDRRRHGKIGADHLRSGIAGYPPLRDCSAKVGLPGRHCGPGRTDPVSAFGPVFGDLSEFWLSWCFFRLLIWGPVAFELVLYPLAIAVGGTVYEGRVAVAS